MEDRELDGLLAVMLFGYTWRMASYDDGTRSALYPPAIFGDREPDVIRAMDAMRHVPYFSQRPDDSLKVADKLLELKFIIDIVGDRKKWVVAFRYQDDNDMRKTIQTDFHEDQSFSRAICLAALEAAAHLESLNHAQETT